MCEHYYSLVRGRFWLCLECKIVGVEITGRQFQWEKGKIKEYPNHEKDSNCS